GHLLEATELPAMSLGVIPFTAHRKPLWPLESFTVFDDERVHVELLSAQVTVTAPSEITLYVRAFEKLAELAVYRAQARALIAAAGRGLGRLPRKVSQARFITFLPSSWLTVTA